MSLASFGFRNPAIGDAGQWSDSIVFMNVSSFKLPGPLGFMFPPFHPTANVIDSTGSRPGPFL
jgi:hypothetical protein